MFVKGYGFLCFAKNMSKNIGKNISKNLICTYSEKRLDHTKQSVIVALKIASKRAIQKTAEVTGNMTGKKIADIITNVYKTLPHNNSETFANKDVK